MSPYGSIGRTALSCLLTLQLGVVGALQVAGAEPIRSNIAEMGYPSWFRVAVGLAQILGVGALWLPRIRFAGAVGLAILLAGAVVSHVRCGHDAEHTAPAIVTFALVSLLAWARRPEGRRSHATPEH